MSAVPGVHTARTATPRKVMVTDRNLHLITGGRIVNGTYSRDPANTGNVDVLRAGIILGKRTSDSLYAPSIIGVLAVAHSSSGTALTALNVGVANAVEIVRRIGATGTFYLTGPPSAAGTVASTTVTYSAVNVTTGIVTITDIAVNKIAGTFIQAIDGSETPVCLLYDGYGLKVTDDLDANINVQAPALVVGGEVDASQIVHWPTDTSLRTWVMGTLNGGDGTAAGGGPFIFDYRL